MEISKILRAACRVFIEIIISLGVFVSCGESNEGKLLKQADEIIEEDPEKSLNLLYTLHPDELSRDDYAYYSLLYTQAQIKCWVRVSSDSLIRFAAEYYKNDNGSDLKIRSLFYKGMVEYYGKDLQEAMRYVIVAYETAKDANNFYWIAKSAELISDIYIEVYNYSQAEKYTTETIRNYALAGKETNKRYALCDLASIYMGENKYSQATLLLDSLDVLFNNSEPIDSGLLDYLKNPMVINKVWTGRLDELEESDYAYLEKGVSDYNAIDNILELSHISCAEGDFEKSQELLTKASLISKSEEQRVRVLYEKYLYAKSVGNYFDAAIMSDTLIMMQSKIAENILNESIAGIQRDFYSNKALKHERESKSMFVIMIAVVLFATIVIILLLWIYRLRMKNKVIELESAMTSLMYLTEQSQEINSQNKVLTNRLKEDTDTITELKKELDSKYNIEEQNAKEIETLFKGKWSTLNMLCNEYFEKEDSESTRKAILNNIENELKKLHSKENLQKIEESVDNYLGGIMSYLRNECTFLKEEDFTFLSLIFAGFSVRAVCLFTGMKYKHFYLKKSRLTKRISASEALHKELFFYHLK